MSSLERLDCADVAMQPAGGLPYGIKRRVEIARALALEPTLLLLDEPAAGLNESEQADLARALRRSPTTASRLLVIEHNMPFLMPLAGRIAASTTASESRWGRPPRFAPIRRWSRPTSASRRAE